MTQTYFILIGKSHHCIVSLDESATFRDIFSCFELVPCEHPNLDIYYSHFNCVTGFKQIRDRFRDLELQLILDSSCPEKPQVLLQLIRYSILY
jgi:hypothetical protein